MMPQTRLAGGFPRVRTPAPGEVIALDPDIPAAHQRVVLVGGGTDAALRWVLDGEDLGAVAGPLLWESAPGTHTLSLVDDARHTLDTMRFEVHPLMTAGSSPPEAR
jgi:penicillin-binding protein 1C